MCGQSPQEETFLPPIKKERAEDEKLIQTLWKKLNSITAGEGSLVACAVYNTTLKTFDMSKILFGGVLSGGQQRHVCVYTHAFEGAPRGRHCPKHSMKCTVCFQWLFVCFQSRFSSLVVELLGKFLEKVLVWLLMNVLKRGLKKLTCSHTLTLQTFHSFDRLDFGVLHLILLREIVCQE